MWINQVLLCCCLLLTSLTNAASNRQRSQDESLEEPEGYSLFGNTEEVKTTQSVMIETFIANTTSATKTTEPKKAEKKSIRKIELPKDYNKLQVPTIKNLNFEVAVKKMPQYFQDLVATLSSQMDLGSIFMSKFGDTPLGITVDVQVRNVRSVDEIKEEITVELDFIAMWLDYILFLENDNDFDVFNIINDNITEGLKSLDPSFLNLIWKPDLFIENVVSISRPELITKPFRLLYSPAGYIIFSTRVTVRMDCQMEFYYYPADTQTCVFRIRSYSYTTKDVDIEWDTPGPSLLDRNEHNFDVKLDILKSIDFVESEGLLDSNYSETYKILQFKISGRRKMSYHLIQTYLPSSFFIVITWMTFLIPATMVEARIGISMTTLLTLTSMFASVRENAPTVSYVKAIDIWMVVCIFFVFLTLFEFTLITWRRHLTTTPLGTATTPMDDEEIAEGLPLKSDTVAVDLDLIGTGNGDGEDLSAIGTAHAKLCDLYLSVKHESRTQTEAWLPFIVKRIQEKDIEKYGFRTFSVLFILFNCVYWPWLMLASAYYDWEIDSAFNI